MRRRYIVIPFLLGASHSAHAASNPVPLYRLTEIPLPAVSNTPSAINSLGQVITHPTGGGAYLWTPTSPNGPTGTVTRISDLPVYWTARAINDAGQVVGTQFGNVVVWTPTAPNAATGALTILPVLPTWDPLLPPTPIGINNAGQVTGLGRPDVSSHAALWTPATPGGTDYVPADLAATLAPPSDSVGYAINNAGQVAGYTYVTTPAGHFARRASVWIPDTPNGTTGTFRTLPPPTPGKPETDYSTALAINDAGDVAGYSIVTIDGATRAHAFLWPANAPSTVVDLGGPPESYANAINPSDSVVGYANYPAGQHAFLWTPSTGMLDLNSLLDPATGAGWTLYTATGINAAGQIVGTGLGPDNRVHPFLLTPVVPEPAAALLPILLFTTRRARRRRPCT